MWDSGIRPASDAWDIISDSEENKRYRFIWMERLANTAIQAISSHDVNGLLTTAEKNSMQGNSTLAVGLNLYRGTGKT